jgi:hypothetical protein
MTVHTSRSRRLGRLSAPTLLVLLSLGMLATSTAGAVSDPLDAAAATAGQVATAATETPMVLQNVTLADLVANKRGICNGGFTHVIKSAAGPNNARNYLNAAEACGLKVIFTFPDTVNYSLGRVYPSRVAKWVSIVKDHPALFGYLTVKEPSWNRISASEIRSLYAAFRKADPNHPVLALFGDIPHFNQKGNTWGKGMADILMVDWYPVETARSGCSRTGSKMLTSGPRHLRHVRSVVDLKTPGTPVWVMVQTHKNLAPTCHKKQRPTEAQLRRQVREAINSAAAVGIAFHTFDNSSYTKDERRDPAMVGWMRTIANQVHAGTFQ